MKSSTLICAVLILIPLFCIQPVSAQPDFDDLFSGGDWSIGFNDGENVTIELDDDGDASVDFWVHNEYQVAIDVAFTFDEAFGATTEEISSTSISAGTNDSFTLEFSDVDVLNFRAEKRESFSITVTIEAYAGFPAPVEDPKTISGELTIPSIRGFEIEIEEPGGAMNAGTELNLNIEVKNIGNGMDLTAEAMFESKACPQLDISNIANLNDVSIDAALEGQSGMKTISVTLKAPLSHPSKTCDLTIMLSSSGSIKAGENASPTEDKINFEVRKPSSSNANIDDGDSNSNSNNNDEDKVSSNFTPGFPFSLTIMSILCATVLIRRK